MIGERLKRARSAAGLSMQALATEVGVSANMIKKYEHDDSMPSSPVLLKLAAALGVRSEFFFRPATVSLGEVEYRKKASAPAKLVKRIEADVLEQAERWLELAQLWPNYPLAPFEYKGPLPTINVPEDIDQVAEQVRDHWQLGRNPLPDLIDLLESKGILVIVSQVEQAEKFDGLQARIDAMPVVVVSAHWPGCRQRFTLAHELGHLLLHQRLPQSMDEERACHRFASAFLLPASGVFQHLGEKRDRIDPRELYLLKNEYGLSMSACLYRSADLGVISEAERTRMFKLFSKNGWRKQEPGEPYPPERTHLFQQLVYRALGEGIVTEGKAAELLNTPLMQLHRQRTMQAEAC